MKAFVVMILFACSLLGFNSAVAQKNTPIYYVPDSSTAAAIAEAVALPILKMDSASAIKTHSVGLTKNVWTVRVYVTGVRVKGGLLIIKLSRINARIISVQSEI